MLSVDPNETPYFQDFNVLREIGQGAYATVHLAMFRKKALALKMVNKEKLIKTGKKRSFLNEIQTLE